MIAEAHEGRISVVSEEHDGATFRVEFPLAAGARGDLRLTDGTAAIDRTSPDPTSVRP